MQELYEVATKHRLHLIGSNIRWQCGTALEHIKAVMRRTNDHGTKHVYVHALLDGRDVVPQCAQRLFKRLRSVYGIAKLWKMATVSGRYYAMDPR